jgi:hypothetical protein
MAMVCPQCNGSYEQSLHCPTCGVHLLYESKTHSGDRAGEDGRWLHTPLGRIFAGIMLAQGLAYGLQMLCTAGLLAAVEEGQNPVWSTLFGLVLLQSLQGLSLLIGGALAGAGQRRAIAVGAVVGLVHAFILIFLQRLRGDAITEVALYGQPVLHIAFGTLGAVIGSCIWRPLPTLARPEFDTDKKAPRSRRSKSAWATLRGPVAWGRVFAGIIVVTAGFLWGPAFLNLVLEASQGKLKINDHLQAQLITWEIIGLGTLLGAALAGATTRNGLKQGMCVGIGASIVLVGNYLGARTVGPEQIGMTVFSIMCLTVAGGWFGGQLFPAVQSAGRHRGYGSAA